MVTAVDLLHRCSQRRLRVRARCSFDHLAGAASRRSRRSTVANSFTPDDVTRLDLAYHATVRHLGLAQREDGAALQVAKRIVELAAEGERDLERLMAATIKAFKLSAPRA